MKLEDLKPACTIHVDAAGRTMKEWSFPPNHLPAGQHKLYTLEQLLPIIHEMAREQLKLETELTNANATIQEMALQALADDGQWMEKTNQLLDQKRELQRKHLNFVDYVYRIYGYRED